MTMGQGDAARAAQVLLQALGIPALHHVRDYIAHLERNGHAAEAKHWHAVAQLIERQCPNAVAGAC